MIRVKDIEKSLKFYQDVLGLSLVRTLEMPAAGFNNYFLGYTGGRTLESEYEIPRLEGLLELTWNYGTEKEENFKYHNGNDQPQGFGHICWFPSWTLARSWTDGYIGISVDNIDQACQRFEDLQCNWKKRLTDGRMKNIAFLLDPDGYWVEVIQNERLAGKA